MATRTSTDPSGAQSETGGAPLPTAPPYVPPPAGSPSAGAAYAMMPVTGVPPLPSGVTLAPVGRRIGAYFLGFLLMIVTLVIGYIIWGLVVWGRGTTPALSVLKMRCVKVDSGQKATFGTMALREIVGRIVDGILGVITELLSFFLFLSRSDRRSLHDLVAGTVVVYDPQNLLDGAV